MSPQKFFKKQVQNFGTLVKRDSLMIRDPHRQPFIDPTFKTNPSPVAYMKSKPTSKDLIAKMKHS